MSQPEISVNWLEQSLQPDEGRIESVRWRKVGTGQVAASYRGELHWSSPSSAAPTSVVVKCPSEDPTSRATSLEFGLYEKELFWYEHLRSRSSIHCPQFYASWFAPDTGEFQLLLQDCAPAQQGDQIRGASVEQVIAGVKELAYLHAPFIGDAELANHPLFQKDKSMKDIRIGLYEQFWPAFKQRYQYRIDAKILAMGDVVAQHYVQLENREPVLSTLVHGDFRLDNLLYAGDNDRPYVLDWQTMGIGCPMKDLAYFIGTSLADPAERAERELDIVGCYFDTLQAQGAVFDRPALLTEYRLQAISGLVMAVFSSMLVERTERGDEMFAVMAERPGWQALALNSVSVLTQN